MRPRSPRILAGAALVCTLLIPQVGHAAGDDPPASAASAPQSEWYGGKVLALDGAALALLTTGAAVSPGDHKGLLTKTFLVLSAGTYALGGPIVHWTKGEEASAAKSLGLRIGLPLILGAMGGLGSDRGHGYYGRMARGFVGVTMLTLGIVTASVVDSVWLARREVTPDMPSGAPTEAPSTQGLSLRFGQHHTAAGRPWVGL